MGLIIFLSAVGVVALVIGMWAFVQIYKEDKTPQGKAPL